MTLNGVVVNVAQCTASFETSQYKLDVPDVAVGVKVNVSCVDFDALDLSTIPRPTTASVETAASMNVDGELAFGIT